MYGSVLRDTPCVRLEYKDSKFSTVGFIKEGRSGRDSLCSKLSLDLKNVPLYDLLHLGSFFQQRIRGKIFSFVSTTHLMNGSIKLPEGWSALGCWT